MQDTESTITVTQSGPRMAPGDRRPMLVNGAQVGEILRVEVPTDPERAWVGRIFGDWGRFESGTRFGVLDLVAQEFAREPVSA